MRTTKTAPPEKRARRSAQQQRRADVKDCPPHAIHDVADFVLRAMKIYGTETNEDRAIPSLQDGQKPVQRKLLFAAKSICATREGKTARLIGEVIGRYHPHGDSSAADALATMVNAPTPLFYGQGNWGSLIDPPAAMRYTEVKLSPMGHQMLHPDYMPIVPMMPNYDERTQEPIFLPALLPFILMNPSLGIGTGVATLIPAFTPDSLLRLTIDIMRGGDPSAVEMRKTLEFNEAWGATPVNTKENRQAIEAIMVDSPSTSVKFQTEMEIDEARKVVQIHGASYKFSPTSFIRRFKGIKGVARITSSKSTITIHALKGLPPQSFNALCSLIRKATITSAPYSIYVCKRRPEGDGKYRTEFMRLSVRGLIDEWIQFRIALEYHSLRWRLGKVEALLHRLRLMVFAAKHLDVVFAALRSPDSAAYLVKYLKITAEDAQTILELKVRQLSKLDVAQTNAKIADAEAVRKDLERRLKKPESTVIEMLEETLKAIRVIPDNSRQKLLPGFRQWELTRQPVSVVQEDVEEQTQE